MSVWCFIQSSLKAQPLWIFGTLVNGALNMSGDTVEVAIASKFVN